jgi:hypothetical protein
MRDPQQHFDSSNHADRVVKFVDARARSIVSADRQGDGAVRIDAIGTGSGVIFDDEDSRIFPISAGGHRLHKPSDAVIFVHRLCF